MQRGRLQSTGVSLYRENTKYFRDEVTVTRTVPKARLDDLFAGRRFDFVKIDSSIVLAFQRDPVALAKLKAITRVCRTLGIRTIAEFVESDEIWEGLQALDVDYAQGFGIGAPRPLDDI